MWCSLIISILNILSLSTYTFLSLYITPSTSLYSLFLNIFISACFISSTAFITSSSFTLNCFTFSSRSTSFMITFTSSVLYTFSHSSLTKVSFLLSFSTPTSQSGLLLRLSTFSILLSRIYLSAKSNLDRYRVYFACLLFNFCAFIKYSRFLWSVQTLNFVVVPSRKYLYTSKYLITANISLSCISYFLSISLRDFKIKATGLYTPLELFTDSTPPVV